MVSRPLPAAPVLPARGARRGEAWGLLITLGTVAALLALHAADLNFRYPGGFLFLAVVASTFVGGRRIGLLSAALSWLYSAYNVADSLLPLRFSSDDLQRLWPLGLTYPAIAALVGTLHERARARAADLARLNASLEEQVALRTAELRTAKARLRGVVHGAPVLLLALDETGRHTLADGQGLTALGAAPEALVGKSAEEVYHSHPQVLRAVQRALGGEEVREALRWGERTFDGRLSPQRGEDGRVTGVLGVATDITEETLARDELRRAMEDLERFAHAASHDLREPVRSITSFTQLLRLRHAGALDDAGLRALGHVEVAARRLGQLVDGLGTYTQLGAPVRRPVPLAEVLSGALAALDPQARAAVGVTGPLPTVLGDPAQLTQALAELLGNGVKFTRPGVPPRVVVTAERDGLLWRVSVRDNGAGMEPQYLERVFVMFERLHSREQHEGRGLGLALARRIIERHGGRLWAQSTPGEGSTFSFTLPGAAPAS